MATNGSSPDRNALEKIADWAKAEPGVSVAGDGTLTVAGDTPITVMVTADDERVQLTHHHTEHTADATRVEAVRRALPGRGSGVTGTVAADDATMEMTLTATLYIDGLTRQGFVAALNELVAATDRAAGSVPSAIVETMPAAPPAAAPAVAEATPVAADATPTMVISQVWSPTHRVPEGGLRAWPKPDPAVEPVATLQARVELSIAERRGDWARVVGSNGWTGWVDTRRLLPMTTAATGTQASSTGGAFPFGAVGAAAMIAAAFLPWFDVGGFTANAFDVALPFLWDLAASGDPALGFVVAGLGAIGLLASFLPGVPDGLRRLTGIAGIAAAGVFVFQVDRGVDGTLSDTIDALGYGVYVALAGAVLLLTATRAKPSTS
ncbi:MAG TPA: SH3 domain-containing protein [Acidimicrobiia bacterium]|nr:SH3 domain-containing protein [Acidimicrobiia bacterium]